MAEFKVGKSGETEAQFRQFLAQMFQMGSSYQVAKSGVLGGTGLKVVQTMTASASVTVGRGAAIAQDTALNGASPLVNTTDKTLDILGANPMGGVPRNDMVVFDAATETIYAIIGTPNATPTDPTVPATAVPLARLRHAASATTVPTAKIDDLRVFTTMRGGVMIAFSQADRDALFAVEGNVVYRGDTNTLEIHNGSGWDVFTPRGSSGVRNIGQVGANAFATWTVNFPAGVFSSAPRVVASASTGRLNMAVRNVTASSCTVEAYNASTVATSTDGEFFQWIAVPF